MGGSLCDGLPVRLVAAAILSALVAGLVTPAPASAADLFLRGERELYLALDKLDGMGALPGFLADTRPYTVAAVRAALDNNAAAIQGSGFEAQLARWLWIVVRTPLIARGTVGVEGSEKRETRDNEDGVPTPKGLSARLSALARETSSPYVSANASASWFYGEGGDSGTRIGETLLEAGLPYASLQIGKLSTWYGPGRRGSLIFTNNAQPYPGIRLHNPVPIAVPGWFSFLGNVQYDLFFARLGDGDRPVDDPLLSGMRIAARPSRYFEIGASRAIQFGGEGRDESFSTYWDILTGQRESAGGTPTGNSLASIDAKVYLPLRVQPVVLYGEWGGEDQSQPFVFTRHAWMAGVFLPSIGSMRQADLRVEYGTTNTNASGVWYQHPDYPHEYRGRVLGHPMGTDARDLYVQGHYYLSPSAYAELTMTRTERQGTDGQPEERTDRAALGLVGWLSEKIRVEGEVSWEYVRNPGNVAGPSASDAAFRLAISYQLERGRPLEIR